MENEKLPPGGETLLMPANTTNRNVILCIQTNSWWQQVNVLSHIKSKTTKLRNMDLFSRYAALKSNLACVPLRFIISL